MALQLLQCCSLWGSSLVGQQECVSCNPRQRPCTFTVLASLKPGAPRAIKTETIAKDLQLGQEMEPTNTTRYTSGKSAHRSGASVSQDGRLHFHKQVVEEAEPLRDATGSLALAVCNSLEGLINTLLEPPKRPMRTDPRIQMGGNFAPVDECPPRSDIEVVGTIPPSLNGVYIRNGSNPQHKPVAGYHNFDGDGMLHAVKIKDGNASYCCRYTRTNRFMQEMKFGQPLFTNALGELDGLEGLARLALFQLRNTLGVVDSAKGIGAANAGLAFFNGKLLAMSEDDKPYAVQVKEDGDLETIGRYNFGGKLKHTMTAHPKVDPKTGEMFSYSYNLLEEPFLSYFQVSPEGQKGVDVPITLPEPVLLHDFVVTKNYIIIPEIQMVFRLQEMFNGRSPIFCDEKKMSRFGVMPKFARTEARLRWFNVPAASCFHYINGWEEGDEIMIVGSTLSPLTNTFNKPHALDCRLTQFCLNLQSGQTSRQQISSANLDVGQCNPLYMGKKSRYVYMSISGPWPKFSGIAKVDLQASPTVPEGADREETVVAWRKYPKGCYGSEPWFVPRSSDPGIAEDDGYIFTYYHDERSGISELLILDAQSPTLEPVASLKLPTRVPYGFHGIFLTEEQLAQQKPTL